jgi:hypothetical protein
MSLSLQERQEELSSRRGVKEERNEKRKHGFFISTNSSSVVLLLVLVGGHELLMFVLLLPPCRLFPAFYFELNLTLNFYVPLHYVNRQSDLNVFVCVRVCVSYSLVVYKIYK